MEEQIVNAQAELSLELHVVLIPFKKGLCIQQSKQKVRKLSSPEKFPQKLASVFIINLCCHSLFGPDFSYLRGVDTL